MSRPVDEPIPDVSFSPLIITGAARGIGLAVARLACAAGADVVLIDQGDDIARVGDELLSSTRSRVLSIACDVSDEAGVDGAFDLASKTFGPPRGVVVSAGIDRGGPLHELAVGDWDRVIGVNLRGAYLTCRAALRGMLPAKRGSIVCMSSPFALVSPPGGASAYCASKGGVSALVRALAVEYAPQGIRVNAVLPGPTETQLMWANVAPQRVAQVRATVHQEVPLGRLAEPEEPACAALWLLSDAASYVTGSQIACDGGVLAKASISV